jgi:hypothetical protein
LKEKYYNTEKKKEANMKEKGGKRKDEVKIEDKIVK